MNRFWYTYKYIYMKMGLTHRKWITFLMDSKLVSVHFVALSSRECIDRYCHIRFSINGAAYRVAGGLQSRSPVCRQSDTFQWAA